MSNRQKTKKIVVKSFLLLDAWAQDDVIFTEDEYDPGATSDQV